MAARSRMDPGGVMDVDINVAAAIARTKVAQRELGVDAIPLSDFRVWDARQTNLPGTSADDDLAYIFGLLGTTGPTLQTSDLKTVVGPTARYAAVTRPLPADYEAGQSVTVRVWAGMKTTVAGTSATCDVQAYQHNKDLTTSADLCATVAQNCNSLTFASFDFVITPTTLEAGDMLDIRVALTLSDAATGTAVIGVIAQVELLSDRR